MFICREVCIGMENKRYIKRTINNVVQLARLFVDISARCNMSERYKTLGKWLVWVNGTHSFVSIFHHAWHWEVSPLLIHAMGRTLSYVYAVVGLNDAE